jgi:predicted regulator of Ras-like GTPase activity (Roadblock/LC7/MglB family)
MTHYTIPAPAGQARLSEIAALPGVRHAAIIDSAGLCLLHAGHEPVSPTLLTDWTVLARAAFLASDDMGQRCGIGPCTESVQTHRDGGTLMRQMPGGMMMIIQHTTQTNVGVLRMEVRSAAETLPVAVEAKTRPQRATSSPLSADPFAAGWWSDRAAAAAPTPAEPKRAAVQEAELVH